MIKRIAPLALLTAVLIGVLAYSQRATGPLKVSGFIEADEIRIGSRVGGRVAAVLVEEGATVSKGQELVRLEPFDLIESQREAAAQLAARQADLDRLAAGYQPEEIRQAKARVDQIAAQLEKLTNGPRPEEIAAAKGRQQAAEVELTLAQRTLDRASNLRDSNAVSQQEYEEADEKMKSARANLTVRNNELQLLEAGTRQEELDEAKAKLAEAEAAWELMKNGYRNELVRQAAAARDAAQATLDAIGQRLDELVIRSPVAGVVEALELQPGDLVSASGPVMSLMDNTNLWVRAYVPENHLDLQVGQRLPMSVDSFPDERFACEISFIARRAEFTPSNIQTPEERSKQVFRIKATIVEGLDRLRPGMSADLWLGEIEQPSAKNADE
ncbi:Multidrug export protein EmrA [Rosistilla oblonga]|uniref:HlyD family secretion protein n=1 Tax=Rosistilla oblonga TaxID=2527990 RepID=UPI00118C6BCE|nr:efflux RND transporter periplasmic adaptor subunit [Rosistilla oblonga]QDV10477.1 Multidrug export protein EmrA [Rosistilla oblonga]